MLVSAANADGATFQGDAYALLAFIYKSEDLPLTFRMRAAETAIAYERPKLAQVEFRQEDKSGMSELMRLINGSGRGLPRDNPELMRYAAEEGLLP
jgi:hypothetical protein